jgi:predicted nucleic acid-binding protein
MAIITLKNIPADLHRDPKKRAEEHHRSLNKEIIATKCSAYDCEFVALAHANGVRLLTVDREILHDFPEVDISLKRFVRDRGSVANP